MKSVFGLLLIMLLSAGTTLAQEKKEQQQIKIVISDKDGEKIVIDTTFNNTASVDSIKLKDGSVVYIGKPYGFTTAHVSAGEPGKVIVIRSDGKNIEGEEGNVMTWVTKEGDSDNQSVVYVYKMNNGVKDGEVKYNVEVKTHDTGKESEKTSYVVAKDGMVVTIEGGNEEKVRELASVIESKLGVTGDGKTGLKEVKEETKKTVKK